ncbi:MAG TPA: methyltransferase domain-containing protein [Arthrobacter sp.]|nr:methyltransferase domain-containing protein [Arthrobacter sp.]
MPSSVALVLRCPVCRSPLARADDAGSQVPGKALVCAAGHSFDAARQGYFNLLVGKGTAFEADTADMVAARVSFLASGHYRPLADAVAAAVVPLLPADAATVLDSGTGTGHYLRVLLDAAAAASARVTAIGLDISKFALRRAARLNPDATNLVCDVWQPLPVRDDSVDVVTVIFAPRNPPEFARILRPGGRLVVVTPRAGHLAAIAERTGMLGIEAGKDDRLVDAMSGQFTVDSVRDLDLPLVLGPREVADLAYMGPAGHHLDRATLADRLAGLEAGTAVEARFRITVFRLAPPSR